MYVIGTSEYSFIKIWTKMMMDCSIKIDTIEYECDLEKSTLLPSYESAFKMLNEIQERKSKIRFINESILGELLDRGKEFDVGKLRIYNLIPHLCE